MVHLGGREMSERPTPETDALRKSIDNGAHAEAEMTSFARTLERERDEAREELRTAVQERHDFHWELLDAVRERNEARELLSAAQNALDAIHLEVGGWLKKLIEYK